MGLTIFIYSTVKNFGINNLQFFTVNYKMTCCFYFPKMKSILPIIIIIIIIIFCMN